MVLIQPTGVYTEFDKKIAAVMPKTGSSSPYAYFKENHLKTTQAMFQANSKAGIIQPQTVAKVIFAAAQARKPKTRYKVGLSAIVYSSLRRMVSDRIWDAIMGTQFPMQPKKQ